MILLYTNQTSLVFAKITFDRNIINFDGFHRETNHTLIINALVLSFRGMVFSKGFHLMWHYVLSEWVAF